MTSTDGNWICGSWANPNRGQRRNAVVEGRDANRRNRPAHPNPGIARNRGPGDDPRHDQAPKRRPNHRGRGRRSPHPANEVAKSRPDAVAAGPRSWAKRCRPAAPAPFPPCPTPLDPCGGDGSCSRMSVRSLPDRSSAVLAQFPQDPGMPAIELQNRGNFPDTLHTSDNRICWKIALLLSSAVRPRHPAPARRRDVFPRSRTPNARRPDSL